MLITNYPIRSEKNEIIVDVEISNIHWENDSIGWYEYWGHKEYDKQPWYVDDFTIDNIYYKNKLLRNKKIQEIISKKIYEDDSFKEEIKKQFND